MKKIVSTLVAIALSVGFISPAYASGVTSINQKIVYKPYSNSVTTHEEQERIEREYYKAHPEIAANAGAADCIIVNNGATQLLRSVDPGEGSVRIVTSNMYGTGNILWDAEKKRQRYLQLLELLWIFGAAQQEQSFRLLRGY